MMAGKMKYQISSLPPKERRSTCRNNGSEISAINEEKAQNGHSRIDTGAGMTQTGWSETTNFIELFRSVHEDWKKESLLKPRSTS